MTAVGQRHLLWDACEKVQEQYDPSPVNLVRAAWDPLNAWLEGDAIDELAARVLAARPGDTDLGVAREQVREVVAALLDVLGREYGGLS